MLSRSNLCSGLARTCGFALLLATGVSCASPQNVLTDAEAALEALGELNGKHIRDDLIQTIFSRFCVGK